MYVYYTATSPTIHNRVSRFTANGNVAVAGSEFVLLDLPTLSATNHNGGAMHFGLDGKLYIAVGDNAVGSNSQTLANPLGKMLRVNSNGTIPSDNPFFSQTTGINQAIWALGLRNPFTFSIQPTSGRMFINDVGQNTWEEINEGAAGANYGWPTTEGATTNPAFVTPLYLYSHGSGTFQGCAITGGAFYAGLPAQFPSEYVGDYFFADYCSGWINQLDDSSGARRHVRLWHLVSRRPGGRARGQPLLPRARIVGCRRAHRLHGQPGAGNHAAPGQSHGLGWPVRQLHGRRLWRSAAVVSVAAQVARPSAAPPARRTCCRRRR